MNRFKLVAVIFLMAALLLTVPGTSAMADDYNETPAVTGAGMVVDFFVARPLGFFSTVGGTAMFIVSLPFSALGDNVDDAKNLLVIRPVKYTFTRPLGEF